jgi:DNA polymerase-3 subunit epsilon
VNIPDSIQEVTIHRLGQVRADAPDPDYGGRNLVHACIVDTETTGVEHAVDRVIEIAVIPFMFDRDTAELVSIGTPYNALQDPGMPIPADASATNGITDADVKGQTIDWQRVEDMLSKCGLTIAHNAKFDRPFVDKELQRAGITRSHHVWACSMSMVNWKAKVGAPSQALEVLGLWYGFFYSAHRATGDCWATLRVLQLSRTMPALLSAAWTTGFRIYACGAAFGQATAAIKARRVDGNRYAWEPGPPGRKAWWIQVRGEAARDAELAWLQSEVYGRSRSGALVLPVAACDFFRQEATPA